MKERKNKENRLRLLYKVVTVNKIIKAHTKIVLKHCEYETRNHLN